MKSNQFTTGALATVALLAGSVAEAGGQGGGGGFAVEANSMDLAGINSVFEAQGLASTRSVPVSWSGFGYAQFGSGFRVGGGGGGFGAKEQTNGRNSGSYGGGYGGLILGQALPLGGLSLAADVMVGAGGVGVEVFGSTQNGAVTQGFYFARPSLGIELRLFSGLHLGLKGQYFAPLGSFGTRTSGDVLDVDVTPKKLFGARVEFIFGSF